MFKPNIGAADQLDRHSEKRSDAAFIEAKRNAADTRFFVLTDGKPVINSAGVGEEGSVRWFSLADLKSFHLPVEQAYFLGTDRSDGHAQFGLAISDHQASLVPEPTKNMRPAVDLRSIAMQGALPSVELSTIGMAKALYHWHDGARHCGHCGGTTEMKDAGWRRECWSCGRQHFPRTDPVVIMLVVDPPNDRCLLGHEQRFERMMWSTLAGFLEPGEDIAHAVRRETMEEVGLKVGEVRYHSTQPWPLPHSMMIGCHAFAETTDIKIDPNEIQDARWFTRAEIRQMVEGAHPEGITIPGQHAIARALILAFADGEV